MLSGVRMDKWVLLILWIGPHTGNYPVLAVHISPTEDACWKQTSRLEKSGVGNFLSECILLRDIPDDYEVHWL